MKKAFVMVILLIVCTFAGNKVNEYRGISWGASIATIQKYFPNTTRESAENIVFLTQKAPVTSISSRQFRFYKGQFMGVYILFSDETGASLSPIFAKLKETYGTASDSKEVSKSISGFNAKGYIFLWEGTTNIEYSAYDVYNKYNYRTGESVATLYLASSAIQKQVRADLTKKKSKEIEF